MNKDSKYVKSEPRIDYDKLRMDIRQDLIEVANKYANDVGVSYLGVLEEVKYVVRYLL